MKPLGMAQDKPLPQKDPLEGTQEIQMGDVDRPPFFNENQTGLWTAMFRYIPSAI